MGIAMNLKIDGHSPIPIRRQLTEQLKHVIESGGVARDQALPSIRELAGFLGINTNTVARVVEDLKQSGYVEARRGKGVFVAPAPPVRPAPHLREGFLQDTVMRAAAIGMTADDLAVAVLSVASVRPAAVQETVEALHRLAQLPSGTRVGVASAAVATAHSLEHSIANAGLPNIVLVGASPAQGARLGRLLRRVDVIVCSTAAAEWVRALAGPAVQVMIDDRALDRRAIEMLAALLVRQNGDRPAAAPPAGQRRLSPRASSGRKRRRGGTRATVR